MSHTDLLLEDWEGEHDLIRAVLEDGDREISQAWLKTVEIVKQYADSAQYWRVGVDALPFVWHTQICSESLDGVRLPYPQMLVEYTMDYEAIGVTPGFDNVVRSEAPRRVLLLREKWDGFLITVIAEANTPQVKEYMPEMPRWIAGSFDLYVPYAGLSEIENFLTIGDDGAGFTLDYNYPTGPRVCEGLPFCKYITRNADQDTIKSMVLEMGDELTVSLKLLAILNTRRPPVEKVEAPAKLNKKRKKNGKRLIPDYRVLRVTPPKRAHNGTSVKGVLRRTHWRRGHIRNQPTKNGHYRRWIQPTIVGAGVPEACKETLVK